MLVADTTACFPEIPIPDVIDQLIDLEFTCVEIGLYVDGIPMTTGRLGTEFSECMRMVAAVSRVACEKKQLFCCRLFRGSLAFPSASLT